MKLTYYALKEIQVGDEYRQPGDLIPEAANWKYRRLMLQNGDIASVLVETLPKATQTKLQQYEDELVMRQLEAEEAAKEGVEA